MEETSRRDPRVHREPNGCDGPTGVDGGKGTCASMPHETGNLPQLVDLTLGVAAGKLTKADVAVFLRPHAKRT